MAEVRSYSVLESGIKLASLAYAAGFLTILIHTGPLGVPVLDLFQAITILAGIPIVLALMLLAWLGRLYVSQYRAAHTEMEQFKASIAAADSSVISALLTLATSAILTSVPLVPVTGSLLVSILPGAAKRVSTRLRIPDDWTRRWLARAFALIVFLRLALFAVNFVIVFVLMFIWVWAVYPKIPYSWGGGKPTSIRLIVDADKIPIDDESFKDLFIQTTSPPQTTSPAPTPPAPKTRKSRQIHLLYVTKEAYYVRCSDGPALSIANNAVTAVVWTSAGEQAAGEGACTTAQSRASL